MGNCDSQKEKIKKIESEACEVKKPFESRKKGKSYTLGRTQTSNLNKLHSSNEELPKVQRSIAKKLTRILDQKDKPLFMNDNDTKTSNLFEGDPKMFYSNFRELISSGGNKCWVVESKETKKKRILTEISKNKELNNNYDILLSISHLNIIKYYDYFTHLNKFYYTTEYSEKGTLQSKIDSGDKIEESEICSIAYQILKALFHIHCMGIMHRNVNPSSILIYDDELNENFKVIKLSNFEWSKKFTANGKEEKQKIPFNQFQAPEMENSSYNEKIDIWSLGATIFYAFFQKQPFESKTENTELKFPVGFSPSIDFQEFLKEILQKNRDQRPTALKALNHIWFKRNVLHKIFDIENENILKILKNLKKKGLSRIRKEVKKFLIQNINMTSYILEISNAFEYFDTNSDGKVSKQEIMESYIYLLKVVHNIEYKNSDPKYKLEIDEIYKMYDDNNDGHLSREEFIVASLDCEFFLMEENIDLLYNYLVFKTGDNVDFNSFDLILTKTLWVEKEEMFNKHFKEFQTNRDSFVSRKKFQTLLESLMKLMN